MTERFKKDGEQNFVATQILAIEPVLGGRSKLATAFDVEVETESGLLVLRVSISAAEQLAAGLGRRLQERCSQRLEELQRQAEDPNAREFPDDR